MGIIINDESVGLMFKELRFELTKSALPYATEDALDQIAEEMGLKKTRTVAEEE